MTDPRPSVLLVEDDDLLRDSFRILLDDAGYEVLTAGTAGDAIDATRDHRPGLVILDLGLPDRPGLEVVRTIRRDPDLAEVPVIALTGRVGAGEEAACLEAGCNRYLAKPVAVSELLQEMAAFVGA
jgi:two-component system cell cycle response regulator DivK